MKVASVRKEQTVIVIKVDHWPLSGFGEFVMIRDDLYCVVNEDAAKMELSVVRG